MLNSARNAIVNLAIFFSCLLVSLFIGEFGIRSLYGNRSKQPEHPLITEYDAVLGWRKIANVTGRHATSEYAISESMNSRGIRGPEYSYEKRHDEYRILVLGDSFAEGYTVEFDQLFSEILKYQLNSNTSGRYYEVINTGTGGYSTDQEFLLFANEGTKYSPDLTILLFHDNDVWYNSQPRYWRGYKPLFRLSEDGTLRLTNVPVPKVDPVLRHDATKGAFWKNPLRATTTWLYEKSYIYRLVTDRRIRVLLWRLVKKIGLVRNDDTAPIPDEFRVYQKQENSSVARAWKTTEALLRKLRGEVNSGGSNFLIFYVPTPAGVYQDD